MWTVSRAHTKKCQHYRILMLAMFATEVLLRSYVSATPFNAFNVDVDGFTARQSLMRTIGALGSLCSIQRQFFKDRLKKANLNMDILEW
jgi:hypothetical protein